VAITLRIIVVLALSIFALGCGGGGSVGHEGDVVGGPCTDGACADGSSCLTASMYPAGTCTVDCSSMADCPNGSTCVTESGGVCLLSCDSDDDCREGYNCIEKSTPGDGHAFVCLR
jgi:hypothetical protein